MVKTPERKLWYESLFTQNFVRASWEVGIFRPLADQSQQVGAQRGLESELTGIPQFLQSCVGYNYCPWILNACVCLINECWPA